MADVRLHVDGTLYGGWQQVRVQRSLEQVAGRFELLVSERWSGQDTARPIRPGAACRVSIDGDTVITGHVDAVDIQYDDSAHQVRVTGRDVTGDIVDCSAPSTQFSGRTLHAVATELCRPYGVAVRSEVELPEEFERLKNNEGDSVFETLEAAARVRGVLLVSDGRGGLVITRVDHAPRVATVLRLGGNVTSCRASFGHQGRYKDYTVKGQRAGDDATSGVAAAQPTATVTDKRIIRHRPLTILAEEQVDPDAAKVRAEWERNVRFGRSRRITYTVAEWNHSAGLWGPGILVPVRDDYLGMTGDLLLVDVTLLLDTKGTRAELTLMPREAFLRTELPEPGAPGDIWN